MSSDRSSLVLTIPFDYLAPSQLIAIGVSLALGAALAWWYLRIREPMPVRALRAAHNGDASDYVAYAGSPAPPRRRLSCGKRRLAPSTWVRRTGSGASSRIEPWRKRDAQSAD